MNCRHTENGWCLDCVKELYDEKEKQFEIFKCLYEHATDTEWMTHNAAENSYCPYCANDDNWWRDQKEHNDGCKYVEIMQKAKEIIENKKVVKCQEVDGATILQLPKNVTKEDFENWMNNTLDKPNLSFEHLPEKWTSEDEDEDED